MQKLWSYFHFTDSGNGSGYRDQSLVPVRVPVTEPGTGSGTGLHW